MPEIKITQQDIVNIALLPYGANIHVDWPESWKELKTRSRLRTALAGLDLHHTLSGD